MKRRLFMLAAALSLRGHCTSRHRSVRAHSRKVQPLCISEQPGKFRLKIQNENCPLDSHCGFSNSDELASRFTGISVADLSRDGAHLTATLTAEAGTFTCTGSVHSGELDGESVFTPDAAFAARIQQMGFNVDDSDKLQVYAFLNIETAWIRSLSNKRVFRA